MGKLFVIFMVLALCVATSSGQEEQQLTCEQALSGVQDLFMGEDVDYYLLEEDSVADYWTIFVDADSGSGWEHDCYTVKVPKKISESSKKEGFSKVLHKLPPKGNYRHLMMSSRHSSKQNIIPTVIPNSQGINNDEVAERTYAIILSGGLDKYCNYDRYWNDCSYIYRVLVKKYGIPKDNIIPLMADGSDPEEDTNCLGTGCYKSQSLDLDFDGVDEIELAATRNNLRSVFTKFEGKLNKNDHLFIFVIDHGSVYDNYSGSEILLWNRETLKDFELVELLKPFSSALVNINIVLGQCFSGGFIKPLSDLNCVVATACSARETSKESLSMDGKYDEFVYQWINALNGVTVDGKTVDADFDKNGYITMDEVFNCARARDGENETPQYYSGPHSIGEDLAFNKLPRSIDLYVSDNLKDSGREPNIGTDKSWIGPGIIVRNEDDGGSYYQRPYFKSSHKKNYVYVTVINRGKEDYKRGKYLRLYYSDAATCFNKEHWMSTDYLKEGGMCGIIGEKNIDPIKANESSIVKFDWELSSNVDFDLIMNKQYSLLAEIVDNIDSIEPDNAVRFNVLSSNNIAQKSLMILSGAGAYNQSELIIRNVSDVDEVVTLEFNANDVAASSFMERGCVELTISGNLYKSWMKGGGQHSGFNLKYDTGAEARLVLISSHGSIDDICMLKSQTDILSMNFNTSSINYIKNSGANFSFDVVQKNCKDEIVGGESIIIDIPSSTDTVNILSSQMPEGGFHLEVDDAFLYDDIQWSLNGVYIGDGSSIYVKPSEKEDCYSAICSYTDEKDHLCIGEVYLSNQTSISSIEILSDKINILLACPAQSDGVIEILSLSDNHKIKEIGFLKDQNLIAIDRADLGYGYYILKFIQDGVITNNCKIYLK